MATSETYFPSKYLKASDISGDTVASITEFGEAILQTSSKPQPIIAFEIKADDIECDEFQNRRSALWRHRWMGEQENHHLRHRGQLER